MVPLHGCLVLSEVHSMLDVVNNHDFCSNFYYSSSEMYALQVSFVFVVVVMEIKVFLLHLP